MNKTLRTADVNRVFKMINSAKLSKMDDGGKVKVWHICRAFKPVSNKFNEDIEDAKSKFLPYDGFVNDVLRAQEYEQSVGRGDETPKGCTKEEYDKIMLTSREFPELRQLFLLLIPTVSYQQVHL